MRKETQTLQGWDELRMGGTLNNENWVLTAYGTKWYNSTRQVEIGYADIQDKTSF